jgi:hypothetical protein
MTNASPTRRFRFSVRTLFVAVTVLGVWIGYQCNWIRERRAAAMRTESPELHCVPTDEDEGLYTLPRPRPFVLWLFRQPTYASVSVLFEQRPGGVLDAEQLQEFRRLIALFPEAEVSLSGPGGMTVRPDPFPTPFDPAPADDAEDDPFKPAE